MKRAGLTTPPFCALYRFFPLHGLIDGPDDESLDGFPLALCVGLDGLREAGFFGNANCDSILGGKVTLIDLFLCFVILRHNSTAFHRKNSTKSNAWQHAKMHKKQAKCLALWSIEMHGNMHYNIIVPRGTGKEGGQ